MKIVRESYTEKLWWVPVLVVVDTYGRSYIEIVSLCEALNLERETILARLTTDSFFSLFMTHVEFDEIAGWFIAARVFPIFIASVHESENIRGTTGYRLRLLKLTWANHLDQFPPIPNWPNFADCSSELIREWINVG